MPVYPPRARGLRLLRLAAIAASAVPARRTVAPPSGVLRLFSAGRVESSRRTRSRSGRCHVGTVSARRTTRLRVLCAAAARAGGAMDADGPELSPLTAEEIEQERNAPAPLPTADVGAMSPQEREALRLRSRAIPLVVSHAPLDIIFEDAALLVVSKPSWLKMHPIHRFRGACVCDSAPRNCPGSSVAHVVACHFCSDPRIFSHRRDVT